ncbi:Eaa protein [Salmonella enterica subsp. enterica serovar Muenchen]|uniref:Eaa protein n=1 Tax=Salmonella enterica TaxID=28901 RepID=UPI001F0F4A45|nr:Eaa protein [Salmonella enterica]MCH5440422.1 Eaa protein [Salmonella enterica subsp. enterica serovar Muenchen]
MTTITRERLEWLSKISGRDDMDDINGDEIRELARIALASLDAEPVGEVSDKRHGLVMDGTVDLGGKSTYRIIKGEKAMKRLPLGTKFYIAPPAPVVPDGLRQALSNAGIAAPESDEMLAATSEKYIQMLVTWVKDRKPFQPVPVVPEEITDESTEQRLMGRRWAHSFCAGWNACRAAMLSGGKS